MTFSWRDRELRGEAERFILEAPVSDNHSVPDILSVGHGWADIQGSEDLGLRINSSTVIVVNDVTDLNNMNNNIIYR